MKMKFNELQDTEKIRYRKNHTKRKEPEDNAKCSWNLHKVINNNAKIREILLILLKCCLISTIFGSKSLRFLFYVNFKHTLQNQNDPSSSFLFYQNFLHLEVQNFIFISKLKKI